MQTSKRPSTTTRSDSANSRSSSTQNSSRKQVTEVQKTKNYIKEQQKKIFYLKSVETIQKFYKNQAQVRRCIKMKQIYHNSLIRQKQYFLNYMILQYKQYLVRKRIICKKPFFEMKVLAKDGLRAAAFRNQKLQCRSLKNWYWLKKCVMMSDNDNNTILQYRQNQGRAKLERTKKACIRFMERRTKYLLAIRINDVDQTLALTKIKNQTDQTDFLTQRFLDNNMQWLKTLQSIRIKLQNLSLSHVLAKWASCLENEQLKEYLAYRNHLMLNAHLFHGWALLIKHGKVRKQEYFNKWKQFVFGHVENDQRDEFIKRFLRHKTLKYCLNKWKRFSLGQEQIVRSHYLRQLYGEDSVQKSDQLEPQNPVAPLCTFFLTYWNEYKPIATTIKCLKAWRQITKVGYGWKKYICIQNGKYAIWQAKLALRAWKEIACKPDPTIELTVEEQLQQEMDFQNDVVNDKDLSQSSKKFVGQLLDIQQAKDLERSILLHKFKVSLVRQPIENIKSLCSDIVATETYFFTFFWQNLIFLAIHKLKRKQEKYFKDKPIFDIDRDAQVFQAQIKNMEKSFGLRYVDLLNAFEEKVLGKYISNTYDYKNSILMFLQKSQPELRAFIRSSNSNFFLLFSALNEIILTRCNNLQLTSTAYFIQKNLLKEGKENVPQLNFKIFNLFENYNKNGCYILNYQKLKDEKKTHRAVVQTLYQNRLKQESQYIVSKSVSDWVTAILACGSDREFYSIKKMRKQQLQVKQQILMKRQYDQRCLLTYVQLGDEDNYQDIQMLAQQQLTLKMTDIMKESMKTLITNQMVADEDANEKAIRKQMKLARLAKSEQFMMSTAVPDVTIYEHLIQEISDEEPRADIPKLEVPQLQQISELTDESITKNEEEFQTVYTSRKMTDEEIARSFAVQKFDDRVSVQEINTASMRASAMLKRITIAKEKQADPDPEPEPDPEPVMDFKLPKEKKSPKSKLAKQASKVEEEKPPPPKKEPPKSPRKKQELKPVQQSPLQKQTQPPPKRVKSGVKKVQEILEAVKEADEVKETVQQVPAAAEPKPKTPLVEKKPVTPQNILKSEPALQKPEQVQEQIQQPIGEANSPKPVSQQKPISQSSDKIRPPVARLSGKKITVPKEKSQGEKKEIPQPLSQLSQKRVINSSYEDEPPKVAIKLELQNNGARQTNEIEADFIIKNFDENSIQNSQESDNTPLFQLDFQRPDSQKQKDETFEEAIQNLGDEQSVSRSSVAQLDLMNTNINKKQDKSQISIIEQPDEILDLQNQEEEEQEEELEISAIQQKQEQDQQIVVPPEIKKRYTKLSVLFQQFDAIKAKRKPIEPTPMNIKELLLVKKLLEKNKASVLDITLQALPPIKERIKVARNLNRNLAVMSAYLIRQTKIYNMLAEQICAQNELDQQLFLYKNELRFKRKHFHLKIAKADQLQRKCLSAPLAYQNDWSAIMRPSSVAITISRPHKYKNNQIPGSAKEKSLFSNTGSKPTIAQQQRNSQLRSSSHVNLEIRSVSSLNSTMESQNIQRDSQQRVSQQGYRLTNVPDQQVSKDQKELENLLDQFIDDQRVESQTIKIRLPFEEDIFIRTDALPSDSLLLKNPLFFPENRFTQKVGAAFALDLRQEVVKELEPPRFETLFEINEPNMDSIVESRVESNLKPRASEQCLSQLRTVELNIKEERKKPLSKHAVSEIMRETPKPPEEIYYQPGDLDLQRLAKDEALKKRMIGQQYALKRKYEKRLPLVSASSVLDYTYKGMGAEKSVMMCVKSGIGQLQHTARVLSPLPARRVARYAEIVQGYQNRQDEIEHDIELVAKAMK